MATESSSIAAVCDAEQDNHARIDHVRPFTSDLPGFRGQRRRYQSVPVLPRRGADARGSVHRDRSGPHTRHCLPLRPFAALGGQAAIHQHEVVQHQITHPQERLGQRAGPVC